MTYQDVLDMLDETGLPSAYHHFAEGESPDPPFLVFLFPESDNFGADNRVYQKIDVLNIELYTDRKDPALEESLETIFDNHDLFYQKSETWIEDEMMYEVLYEMRMLIKG